MLKIIIWNLFLKKRLCDLEEKESLNHYQIYNIFAIDVLKNLLKINRFKLVIRLLSKKDKKGNKNFNSNFFKIYLVLEDIFDSFDKDWDSELISIRDSYNNIK